MKKIMFMLSVLVVCNGYARHHNVKSQNGFYSEINRNELSIVLFYEEGKDTHKNRDLSKKVEWLKKDFHNASKSEPYVSFVAVNIDKDQLGGLSQKYEIEQLPTLMLFRNGKPYKQTMKDQDGKLGKQVIQETGFVSYQEIINFVEDYFSSFIDNIIKIRRQIAERRAEQARINALYWGPYWGYGWGWGPYYYGGWPYYGYWW